MKTKLIINWKNFQMYTDQLAEKLRSIKKWKKIIAVSRGGLVPAALIARKLNIRFIDTICIASYNNTELQDNVKILKVSKIHDKNTLIIDDLSDTGGTARIIHKIYPKSYFFTVFSKPIGSVFVNGYIVNIPQNVWVEQPWDISDFKGFQIFQGYNSF